MKKPSRKQQQAELNADVDLPVVNKTSAQPMGTKNNMTSIIEYAEDLSAAEAPVPLPAQDYVATIRSAEQKTSAAGNEYINVTFYIDPDQYPVDFTEGNPDGETLTFGRISPANETRARWGMRKFVEAIGAKPGKKIDLNDWIGLSASVTVVHDTWEGETRAQIKKVNPA